MSGLTAVLRDGSKVPAVAVSSTRILIDAVRKVNDSALVELFRKCEDQNYKFQMGNSKAVLVRFGFMDKDENIPDTVRKVVLNSLKEKEGKMAPVFPLKKLAKM